MKKLTGYYAYVRKFLKNAPLAVLLLLEISFGSFLCILSFVLFLKFGWDVFETEFAVLDRSVAYFFYSLRTPELTLVMRIFSFSGEELTLIIGAITGLLLLFKKHLRELLLFSFMLGVGRIIDIFLKDLTQRPRPTFSPLYVIANDYSFPS